MIALQKLLKMFFISSKNLFWFSRYSNFCNFPLPFHNFQIQKDKWKWYNLWCHELHSGHFPLSKGRRGWGSRENFKKGGGLKIFWIKGGAFPEWGGWKFQGRGRRVGFLDIIFHPFQILFLVSLNRWLFFGFYLCFLRSKWGIWYIALMSHPLSLHSILFSSTYNVIFIKFGCLPFLFIFIQYSVLIL